MNLLAEIYSQPEMVPKMLDKLISAEKHGVDINMFEMDDASGSSPYALSTLVPRLWPFMRHTITSVRNSAICTLVSSLLFLLQFLCVHSGTSQFLAVLTSDDISSFRPLFSPLN
jgi:hypothetical protein